MSGLAKLCKLYGQMRVQGRLYLWDYVAGKAVPEDEMPVGSPRRIASDKARAEWLKSNPPGTSTGELCEKK